MRYKIFPIEADTETSAAHSTNGYKRTVILNNIDIHPELVSIRSEPATFGPKASSFVCMSEEHELFNFDILNNNVMNLRGYDKNSFYNSEYSEMLTNIIKREFPQVYIDYGGRDDEI